MRRKRILWRERILRQNKYNFVTGENPETEENSVAGENHEDRLSADPCPVVEAKGKIRYGTVFGQSEGAAALCGSPLSN